MLHFQKELKNITNEYCYSFRKTKIDDLIDLNSEEKEKITSRYCITAT